MNDTSRNLDIPLMQRQMPCSHPGQCNGTMFYAGTCGCYVCSDCGNHHELARCYCGWSMSGDDGRRELIEMGETL